VSGPRVLVIDLGTTSIRLSVVTSEGAIVDMRRLAVSTDQDDAVATGSDARMLADGVLREAAALLDRHSVLGLAIANQRASCVLWDALTHQPLGPIIGWADGRTRELDLELRSRQVPYIPGLTVSKALWLIRALGDRVPRQRLRAGTLDTWLLWCLTQGDDHATEPTNASHTGAFDLKSGRWDQAAIAALDLPETLLASLRSGAGPFARASALPGAPPVLCMIGDQQAALLGHGLHARGSSKITFGTGAVANVVLGDEPLPDHSRAAFIHVAWSRAQRMAYGAESAVLAAGSAIEWIARLGLLDRVESLEAVLSAARPGSTACFVPALDGLGAPDWIPRARGLFTGLSSSDGRAELTRAVVDGIACQVADVLDGLEAASGVALGTMAVDGGLTRSRAFTEIVAATSGRPLVVGPQAEMTTIGAARLAFEAAGFSFDLRPTLECGEPVMPDGARPADRKAWQDARQLTLQESLARKKRLDQSALQGG